MSITQNNKQNSSDKTVIGYYQSKPVQFSAKHNIDDFHKQLNKVKADLIVTPELLTSGYLFENKQQLLDNALPEDSAIFDDIRIMAKQSNCSLIVGLPIKKQDKIYNSVVAVTPDGKQTIYNKVHLFDNEKKIFTPGDYFTTFNLPNGTTVGLLVCFDWIFPESFRILALMKADIICLSANLVLPYCQRAMITRSIENSTYIIAANRVGTETIPEQNLSLTFTGGSQITDPRGNILINSDQIETGIKTVQIDPKTAHNKMITQNNHVLLDRRDEIYKNYL